MRIVSWNCNGGFRKKYKELFNAYRDADLFMVQECENPDFYNSREYKALFQKGFHVGTPDYSMKGIGVFAPKGNWLRRTSANTEMRCTCLAMLSSRWTTPTRCWLYGPMESM